VIAEVRTNQLFVTDVASKLEQIQELINRLISRFGKYDRGAHRGSVRYLRKSLGVKLGGADLRAQRGGTGGIKSMVRIALRLQQLWQCGRQ